MKYVLTEETIVIAVLEGLDDMTVDKMRANGQHVERVADDADVRLGDRVEHGKVVSVVLTRPSLWKRLLGL